MKTAVDLCVIQLNLNPEEMNAAFSVRSTGQARLIVL